MGFQTLTIFAKSSILDVWQASAYVSALKSCKNVMYIFSMLHIFSKNPSIQVQVLFHKKNFYKEMSLENPKTLRKCWEHLFFLFYSICVLFHEHSRITGLQGKEEGIPLTPHYHFHPLHIHLDISRAITAEGSPLHISGSRTETRTENFWFPRASL